MTTAENTTDVENKIDVESTHDAAAQPPVAAPSPPAPTWWFCQLQNCKSAWIYASSHSEAVEKYKKATGIVSTPHAITATASADHAPSVRDLEINGLA